VQAADPDREQCGRQVDRVAAEEAEEELVRNCPESHKAVVAAGMAAAVAGMAAAVAGRAVVAGKVVAERDKAAVADKVAAADTVVVVGMAVAEQALALN
jgi:hypothetical protein